MSQLRGATCLPLAILLTLASSAGPALGSSIGFHEFLKHRHSDVIALPRLYEPVPKHVPELSNGALLRLWEANQFSPILRNAAIEKQLFEAVSHIRELNPAKFDASHPTIGHLLRDPRFFAYALHLYNTHPGRFVHYHHFLIPFIRGFAIEMMQQPTSSGTAPEQLMAPVLLTVTPSPSPSPSPRRGPSPSPQLFSFPPPESLSIPEPSSIVMMALGLGYLAVRMYKSRPVGPL